MIDYYGMAKAKAYSNSYKYILSHKVYTCLYTSYNYYAEFTVDLNSGP